ncbi:MAG: lipase family protein [Nocardioides sp.]|nr:lipase family protein [Nocardioides sp.]
MKRIPIPHLHARARTVVVAVAAACGLLLTTAAPVQADEREGNLVDSIVKFANAPNSTAGANDWSCQPTAERPTPVILVPGTFFNHGATFVKTAPRLKNAGYCVFALNYGFNRNSLGRLSGLAPASTSVQQLSDFVDRVRTETGAAKVDLVGWSQGGMLPIAYIKQHGGADKVAHYVGWATSANGTTASGLGTLIRSIGSLGFGDVALDALDVQGVRDQLVGSDFIKSLQATPLPAGPKYTSIYSKYDEVVTPYKNSRLPAPATNIRIQDHCAFDFTGHIGLYLDDPTLQLTMNALADGPSNFKPRCHRFGAPFL